MTDHSGPRVRLDRWLWAARFFKTRAQAKAAIEGGKIEIAGGRPKAAKEIGPGTEIRIRRGPDELVVVVTALSEQRGGAPEAQRLYEETVQSIERRETARARRQMERAGLRIPKRRPNKQERRAIDALKRDSGSKADEA